MSLSMLIPRWCPPARGHRLWLITDNSQMELGQNLLHENQEHILEGLLINLDNTPMTSLDHLPCHDQDDLLVVLLSVESFMRGANLLFPSFRSPHGWPAYSLMIRPGIQKASLEAGLATPLSVIQMLESNLHKRAEHRNLRVTNHSGTDLKIRTRAFQALPYACGHNSRHAYLPPAEIYTPLWEDSAEGIIAVDVTVGELRYEGQLLHAFGRVDSPLFIEVHAGKIQKFSGHGFAKVLTKEFTLWDENCRHVVELGFGLSSLTPTGLIGVDESILHTCHFGIGDNRFYGGSLAAPLHWDVVIDKPIWKDVS